MTRRLGLEQRHAPVADDGEGRSGCDYAALRLDFTARLASDSSLPVLEYPGLAVRVL